MDFNKIMAWFIIGVVITAFALGLWIGYSLWG